MNLILDPSRTPELARQQPRTLSAMVHGWLNQPVVMLIGYFALFMVAFGNLVDLEADNDKVSISGQAFVKIVMLGLGGIYGGIGFLSDIRVRQMLFSFPMMWMVILFGCFCLAIPGSPIVLESFASTVSIACVILMTITALVQMGIRSVLKTLFYAMALYVLVSWAAFILKPDVGVFLEPTVDGQSVARMGGLAHPNTLGQVSGLTLVLGLLLFNLESKLSVFKTAVVLLAAGALVFSLSRTSLLACIVAIAVVYRYHIFRRKYLFYALVAACIGLVALMFAAVVFDLGATIQSKIGLVSKSGDTDELFSATGRTEIWAHALHLISQRPLTGYGAATTKIYLADYSYHCHNLVINIAFSTGVFGGLIAFWMCLERTFRLFFRHHPIADALVAFILVNGLFENVIFSILAGIPTMIWTAGLCIPLLKEDEANVLMESKRNLLLESESAEVPASLRWSLQR